MSGKCGCLKHINESSSHIYVVAEVGNYYLPLSVVFNNKPCLDCKKPPFSEKEYKELQHIKNFSNDVERDSFNFLKEKLIHHVFTASTGHSLDIYIRSFRIINDN